mmetsp:Transcript_21163/g.59226  ORF Transcript_21163/g.59226 Transcript_21163/m.59226 type:complete len:423 (-) Transcript_21163:69-1337(-)
MASSTDPPQLEKSASKPTYPEGPIYKAQVPNLITCFVIASGCTLMVSTSIPGFVPEICLVAAAVGLIGDMMDGFLARCLGASSKFGAAFDQLADLTCFGVGPAIFFIRYQMESGNSFFTLISGYIYMACSCGRIARELVVHNIRKPEYFVGIPTNLACPILLLAVYFNPVPSVDWLPLLVLALSALMVMPVDVPKDLGTGLLQRSEKKKDAADAGAAPGNSNGGGSPTFPEGPFYRAQLPNFITCFVIMSGCTLMVSTSIPGFRPEISLVAATVGLVGDMVDGTLARCLGASSKFGAAFDQLADLTCFGIGPAIFFIRHQLASGKDSMTLVVSCIVGYIYMACSVGRIARELVVHNISKPQYFVGIPTNLACPILLVAVYINVLPDLNWLPLLVLVLSALMVMPVDVPKDLGTGILKRVKAK